MQGSMLTVGGRNGKRLCLALQGDEASKSIMMVLLSFQRSKPQRLRKGTERILRSSAEAFELEPTSFRALRIGTYGNLAIHLCNKFFFEPLHEAMMENPRRFIDIDPDQFRPGSIRCWVTYLYMTGIAEYPAYDILMTTLLTLVTQLATTLLSSRSSSNYIVDFCNTTCNYAVLFFFVLLVLLMQHGLH